MSHQKHSREILSSPREIRVEGFFGRGRCAALLFRSLRSPRKPHLHAISKTNKKKSPAATLSGALQGLPIFDLKESEAILHALNRLTYGPRPGDMEAVRQIGLAKWIDLQLNPDSINDSAIQARLGKIPSDAANEFREILQRISATTASREKSRHHSVRNIIQDQRANQQRVK